MQTDIMKGVYDNESNECMETTDAASVFAVV